MADSTASSQSSSSTRQQEPLVKVNNLHISYTVRGAVTEVIHGVDFQILPGEVVSLVGESGSGKSTVAQTLVGMLTSNGHTDSGNIEFAGDDLLKFNEHRWRRLRGNQIGWVPQDPMSSLNPVIRIGRQVSEPLILHRGMGRRLAHGRAIELLERAGLSDPAARAQQFAHQLSGGMRQRVLIAMATACAPRLLIADEPTSALDVTVQRQILDQLSTLVRDEGMAMLLVTHDLSIAADRADRVLVMSQGRLVEQGPAKKVLQEPQDPYTRKLVVAIPGRRSQRSPHLRDRNATQVASPLLLKTRGLHKEFALPGGRDRRVVAVNNVDLSITKGETLGIVGESGSGKSTLARIVLRLEREDAGRVLFSGQDITKVRGEQLRQLRRNLQVVYQNPFTSLDPRLPISTIVEEPLRAFHIGGRDQRARATKDMIDRVALPSSVLTRKPSELSGGQRQRVAIARALVLRPALLVCDEPTSALDVSVQEQILTLLSQLQADLGIGMLFISHDLAVVRDIAHRVLVMRKGGIVESGATDALFRAPKEEYTRELIASIPGTATDIPAISSYNHEGAV